MTTFIDDFASASSSDSPRNRSEEKPVRIKVRDPGHLIAAVPHLLGFVPENSLVVIGHHGKQGARVTMVQRVDLPPPEHEREVTEYLIDNVVRQKATAVTIVIVGVYAGPSSSPSLPETVPPHRRLIETVSDFARGSGPALLHAFWTPSLSQGAPWRCYRDSHCAGELPDPSATPLAAASAVSGSVTFSTREEMEELFTPEKKSALARRSKLLASWVYENDSQKGEDWAFAEVGAALRRLRREKEEGTRLAFDDDRLVRLACALKETSVRDACLALTAPTVNSSREKIPKRKFSAEAERLWWILSRALPAPERAEPATLLGFSAYQRGEGTLAGMAFDVALDADPRHVLAGLLNQALSRGIPPESVSKVAKPDLLNKF